MYRTWVAIGLAGLLGGVAVVSLFVGFGSPVFLGVAAVSAGGGFLAYRYARERMLASVYAGVETDPTTSATGTSGEPGPGRGTDDHTGTARNEADRSDDGAGRRPQGDPERTTQATDGGSTAADYDEWTWADSDPDDPFWSDDPEHWEDPWEWEATDPEDAGANGWRRGSGGGDSEGSERWSGWSDWTGGDPRDGTDDEREHGRRDDRTAPGDRRPGPTVEEAYETLEIEPGADIEAVREAYRERAKETHPDLGGDPEAFIRVREAYERLREEVDDGE